jgi:hypothetical protein
MWAEDLSPAIGARSLRRDSNRRVVPSVLWAVIVLLAGTAAYGQISLPAPGDIDTVAGYGTAGYAGDNGLATAADLYFPLSVAVDTAGNIYIADTHNNCIRKVTASTGIITTVAGNGTAGYSGDGGPATSADVNPDGGVAVDSAGNIYFADNQRIRKVTVSTGYISTVAGNGIQGYSGDGGAATNAEMNWPWGVAVDAAGNIYIADMDNQRMRKVTAVTGVISTVAGNGTQGYSGDGGQATSAEISSPSGVAVDATGNIYFGNIFSNCIRKVTASTGIISTVAGTGTAGFSGDGGLATSAKLYYPYGVAADAAGNIYFADEVNDRIRKVTASTGDISTVAGTGTTGYSGDGGPATSAQLYWPHGVAVDAASNIYIADEDNERIRAVAQIKATPSISVSCSPNPITYGSQTTTCSATLSGGATGTVTWTINGGAWTTTSLSGGTTSAGGFSGWNAGTYTIGVAYGGDSNNNPVSSSTTLTISKATPAVSVFCSPNPITYGGANSICTISASDSGTITGTVSLTYNGTAWTTLSLSSGSATATWSSTSGIGTYTIGATYNGDSNNTTATGSGTVTVNKTSPTVSLRSSVNPLIYGGLSVFTATINGGQSPSGTVTFQVNGQTFGTATVSAGVAIYNGTNEVWAAGTDTISAIYSGDGDNGGATGTLTETINKATPTISWATPAAITYGTALGATQLNASSTVAGTFVYTPATGTVLTAGSSTLSVTITPTDTTDFNTATATVTETVNQATPTITWAAPATITYGTALSTTQLDASSSVAGTFVYSPASDTVLTAGSHTLLVTFTPTDTTDYNTVSGSVSVTVNQSPTIGVLSSSLNPSNYGQSVTLIALINTGGITPTGTVTFKDASTSIGTGTVNTVSTTNLAPYSQQYTSWNSTGVTLTPNAVAAPDGTSTATLIVANSSYTVSQEFSCAPGNIAISSWAMNHSSNPAAAELQFVIEFFDDYGHNLGTFYNNHHLSDSWQRYSDTTTAGANVTQCWLAVNVEDNTGSLTAGIGEYLWGTQVEQSASAGPYVKTSATSTAGNGGIATFSTSSLPAGTDSITAVYGGDTNDASSTSTALSQVVNQAAPTVSTWPTASEITYGQTLASSTLTGGTASTGGAFAWTTPNNAPGAGTARQGVTFTPTDTTDYNTVAGTASVTVAKATPTVSVWPTASGITYGQTLASSTLNGGTASVGGTFSWTTPGTAPGTGTASQGVTFTPADSTDYNSATQTVPLSVNKATPAITWATPAPITYGTALSVTQLDATSGGVAGFFAYTPAAGTVLGVGSQTLSVTFTPSDTTDYNTATGSVTLQVTKSSVLTNSTSSLKPSVYGDSVTWTFTFVGDGITPTGTTTIKDGSVTLATVGLNAGIASYSTSALVAGNHTLTAVYSGDINYQ